VQYPHLLYNCAFARLSGTLQKTKIVHISSNTNTNQQNYSLNMADSTRRLNTGLRQNIYLVTTICAWLCITVCPFEFVRLSFCLFPYSFYFLHGPLLSPHLQNNPWHQASYQKIWWVGSTDGSRAASRLRRDSLFCRRY